MDYTWARNEATYHFHDDRWEIEDKLVRALKEAKFGEEKHIKDVYLAVPNKDYQFSHKFYNGKTEKEKNMYKQNSIIADYYARICMYDLYGNH
jgi:hypothetical protein